MKTSKMSNGLIPDQDRCFVGPDLGPNCLQRLSEVDKVTTSKERVKSEKSHLNGFQSKEIINV